MCTKISEDKISIFSQISVP